MLTYKPWTCIPLNLSCKVLKTFARVPIITPVRVMRRFIMLLFVTICLIDLLGARVCPIWSRNEGEKSIRAIIINRYGKGKYPRRYRSSFDSFETHYRKYMSKKDLPPIHSPPDMTGYSMLRMSGSSQFSIPQLPFIAHHKKLPTIVDLRMEAHGFLDNLPISLFCPRNWDRLKVPLDKLEQDEDQEFRILNGKKEVTVWEKIPQHERVRNAQQLTFQVAQTQSATLSSLNYHQIRIPIPDHRRPRDAQINQLIQLFMETEDDPQWLHFHCQAGKGRTTMVMIMWDMFRNADQVTLSDILHRNYIYAGVHLEDYDGVPEKYRIPFLRERSLFLTAFYYYCQNRLLLLREEGKIFPKWDNFLIKTSHSLVYKTVVNRKKLISTD